MKGNSPLLFLPVLLFAALTCGLSGESDAPASGPSPLAPILIEIPQPPARLELTFAGDIMAHNTNYMMADYSLIYSAVAGVLQTDDLSFGNMEFPVVRNRPSSNFPAFNAPYAYMTAAAAGGFDVFATANNHALDQGRDGALETLNSLRSLAETSGVLFNGTFADPNSRLQPLFFERNGMTIGFLSLTAISNYQAGVDLMNLVDYRQPEQTATLLATIRRLAPACELFIVSYHGQAEYLLEPDPLFRTFCGELLDAGVDIVWAHHTHVLQPWEIVERNGKRKLIMYSMGNFVSAQITVNIDPAHPEGWYTNVGNSALLSVTVESDGVDADVTAISHTWIGHHIFPGVGIRVLPLADLAALPAPWGAFYAERLRLLEARIRPVTLP